MPAAPSTAARTAGAVRVVGVGLTVLDRQMFVPALPGPDEKTTAAAARLQVGGPVPVALTQLRKLGGPAGTVFSPWADDADGRAIEADLRDRGLAFNQAACRCSRVTGTAQVWVEERTGRRSLVALRPGPFPDPAAVAAACADANLLHTDGWPGDAAVAAAEAVRAGGGTVCVDLGGSPKPDRLPALADVLNVPAAAARRLTGRHPADAVRVLLDRGPRMVTVTNGSRGVWFGGRTAGGNEELGFVPAFPADAVDTCGAGDAFCGGLLAATLSRLPPTEAARFAAAVASLKVRAAGNFAALPDRAAVDRLLAGD